MPGFPLSLAGSSLTFFFCVICLTVNLCILSHSFSLWVFILSPKLRCPISLLLNCNILCLYFFYSLVQCYLTIPFQKVYLRIDSSKISKHFADQSYIDKTTPRYSHKIAILLSLRYLPIQANDPFHYPTLWFYHTNLSALSAPLCLLQMQSKLSLTHWVMSSPENPLCQLIFFVIGSVDVSDFSNSRIAPALQYLLGIP
jgi:hypothetical protein